MIYNVTVPVDVHSVDPSVPETLLGAPLVPGALRTIPGGAIVFQAALLTDVPGHSSVYRFALQFGSLHAAMMAGNWLYTKLRGAPVALSIGGHLVPIDHRTIITAIEKTA